MERSGRPLDLKHHVPGTGAEARAAQMIRVNHAGEYGAVRIYEGQLAVLRNRPGAETAVALIEDMAAQEEVHLERFNKLIVERRVRPTALTPIWHAAGFALGAASALLGEKAAMACTAAVEEVIDDHYGAQVRELEGTQDEDLKDLIEEFRADEVAHLNTALEHGAAEAPGYGFLSGAVKSACRFAIGLSEKI